jgi:hypothetical protein
MHFVSACIYVFGMEIIILMDEMLLTHEIENILGTVKHCNRKVARKVVTGIETTKNFIVQKIEIINLLLLIMNMTYA